MANIINAAPVRATDTNDDPVAGANLRFFITGTTAPVITFSDVELTTPHPTPIVADASGVFPAVYYGGTQALRAEVTGPGDVALPGYPIDRVIQNSATQTSAAQISKRPVAGNPASNVEDAINRNTTRLNTIGDPSTAVQALLNADDEEAMREALNLSPGAVEDLRSITGWVSQDIVVHNGTNLVRLPRGMARQVLAMNNAGNALGYVSIFGPGQARVNVTSSRVVNTSYRNTTGRPIEITVQGSSAGALQTSTDDSTFITVATLGAPGSFDVSCTVTIQDGEYYRATGSFSIWTEFR